MSVSVAEKSRASAGLLRYSAWDGLLVALALAHAAVLIGAPSVASIAIGLWWNSNTIAHNFLHSPFFRSRALNRGFAIYLSALLGIPQSIWRDRHLQHHAGRHRAMRLTPETAVEVAVILSIWAWLAAVAPSFFFGVYVPGYGLGLMLCFLQGHYEHARGTTSHYGRVYNWVFFNDGYHVEHHLRPGEHWTRLPRRQSIDARQSRWPPVLRWLDAFTLASLERLVLRSPRLQRFVVVRHERAFRELLRRLPPVGRVTIVGGGLFPRTALILRRLLPAADLTIVEADEEHLAIAEGLLDGTVHLRHSWFDVTVDDEADLVVIPLAFDGDRDRAYTHPPARALLVHDWIWRRRAPGVSVSWLLFKRLNLVVR
jgi:fatty acid desaturase